MQRALWNGATRVLAGVVTAGAIGVGAWFVLPAARAAVEDDDWATQWISTYGAEHDVRNRVITLTESFTTTETLRIPDGYTLDGGGRTISLDSGASLDSSDAILAADVNASEVHIRNLTIDGAHAHAGGFFFGIRLTAVAGSIADTTVRDVRHATDAGSQAGVGIRVDNPEGHEALDFAIDNVKVESYQKGGIVADGALNLTVRDCTVGRGHSSAVAANAVQVSRGTKALLEGNTITGNHYDNPAETYGTAVLMYGESSVELKNNTIRDGDVGLSLSEGLSSLGDQAYTTNSVVLIGNRLTSSANEPESAGIRISSDTSDLPDATITTAGNSIQGYATAYVGQDLAPATPGDLDAEGGKGTITLTWSAPVRTLLPVTGYTIELEDADHTTTTVTAKAGASEITANGIAEGIYTARIRATDGVTPSEWSETFTGIRVGQDELDRTGQTPGPTTTPTPSPTSPGGSTTDPDPTDGGGSGKGGRNQQASPISRADTGL